MPLTPYPSPLEWRGDMPLALDTPARRRRIRRIMSENGSLGAVRVANEVIASIAALAACEVEGVEGMDEAAARHFGDWVRRQAAHRGVRVHIEGDRSIHLEVFITVDSEARLADVAAAVQANVVEATERMLGLEVGEVNVFVSSVAFAT
ncbi:MAG: Asp23/Gls24 family envelope stress response protein [Chloroflexi bacterium]|nr:MAG: Asp23/Gls24 family envelope stress response protein [Chloroflexota bacterium]